MSGKEIVKIARRDLVQGRGHTDMMSDVKAAAMLDANPWAGATLLLLLLLMAVAYLWARHRQRVVDTGLVHLDEEPVPAEAARVS